MCLRMKNCTQTSAFEANETYTKYNDITYIDKVVEERCRCRIKTDIKMKIITTRESIFVFAHTHTLNIRFREEQSRGHWEKIGVRFTRAWERSRPHLGNCQYVSDKRKR